MQKKDFWGIILVDVVFLALFIQFLIGLRFAFELLVMWIVVSFCTHVYILRDYVKDIIRWWYE